MNVYLYLIKQNAIQINGGITINVDVSVKNIIYVKKIIFGILVWKCENGKYLTSIMDDSVIMCHEFIEEIVPTNFNKNKATFLYFTCIFINHYSIIDSCQVFTAIW